VEGVSNHHCVCDNEYKIINEKDEFLAMLLANFAQRRQRD